MTKVCSRCHFEKDISVFGMLSTSLDGHRNICKDCRKAETENRKDVKKEYDKKYFINNKDEKSKKGKEYYRENREDIILASSKRYVEKKEEILKKDKEYVLKNKDKTARYQAAYKKENKCKRRLYYKYNNQKINEARRVYEKERRLKDNDFVVACFLRSGFRKMLNYKSGWRKFSKISGYSKQDYIKYFEDKYRKEFGLYKTTNEYHIDHIIPVSMYDMTNDNDVKKCWNPRNMRIIPARQNLEKKDRFIPSLVYEHKIIDLLPEGVSVATNA